MRTVPLEVTGIPIISSKDMRFNCQKDYIFLPIGEERKRNPFQLMGPLPLPLPGTVDTEDPGSDTNATKWRH